MMLGLYRRGYLENSANTIIGAERPSTRRQYQSTWKNFMLYLAAQGIDHVNISRPVVTDFLDFYSKEFHRKYRTISVYKAALVCPLLWACNVDLDVLDITSRFMRGTFNFDPPDRAAEMPRWSLNVLLKYLRSSHFEPLEFATPVKLTQKLIALIFVIIR